MQGTRLKRGAIGVLHADGRVLMVQRAPNVAKGGCWCFPGGHLEQGETAVDALYREMREELGLRCTGHEYLGAIAVAGGYELEVFLTFCTDFQLRPAPAEIADARWVRREEIVTIEPGLPSNARVAEMLDQRVRGNSL